MKTLNPNNRNPRNGIEFWTVHKLLIEEGSGIASTNVQVGVGNNTIARFRLVGHDDPAAIEFKFHDTVVATLYDDQRCKLTSGGHSSKSTKTRMDWCLLPLGFRLTSIQGKWKVYSINTGAYKDYFDGMIVEKGEF